MFVKRLKRHRRHFLERVALRKSDDEGISGKLETSHVIGIAGFGHDAGIKGAAEQHLKCRCGKGGGCTDTGPSLRHRGYLLEAAIAGHHMLWADCRRDAKTDRRLAGWHVGGDLVTQLAVHRRILAEKPGQMFGNADTATTARIFDKGDAKEAAISDLSMDIQEVEVMAKRFATPKPSEATCRTARLYQADFYNVKWPVCGCRLVWAVVGRK